MFFCDLIKNSVNFAVLVRTNCIGHEMSCGFPAANLSLVSNNREVSV